MQLIQYVRVFRWELSIFISIISLHILISGCATTGDVPLRYAAETGDIKRVAELLDKGADVNEKDKTSRTALMWAAASGHTEAVKLLIEKGAEVNKEEEDGWTALMWAAASGHTEVVKLLIEKGAAVNKEDKNGWTALMRADARGHIEVVKLLIEKGAEVDKEDENGWTVLMRAAKEGRTEVATLLIEKGAEVDKKDKNGWTALMRAAEDGHTEIVKHLLNKRANIDIAIAMLGKYPDDVKAKTGIKMLQRLEEERRIQVTQAAVEVIAYKKKHERPAIQTDIDKPLFKPQDTVMTENDLAVIIGIEGYQSLPKSDYSYDDAKLVKDYVKALGFRERNIQLLTDEKATLSGITKSFEAWLKNKAKAESRVFVYYSGHGAPEPKTGDAYIVPFDGDPNYLEVTGYPLKRLYDKLGKLQVVEVVIVLDSCFSGAGGRSVIAKGVRPLVMMAEGVTLPQNMAVLTATQGTQISTSSPEKGHGIFTYYFLKAIKDGKKTLSEIYEYIKPLVEDEAKQLNVQQSPSINPDVEKLKGRFGLRK